jgi:hypothetical protein
VRDGRQLGNRLNRADFIICVHYRHKRGVIGDNLSHSVG